MYKPPFFSVLLMRHTEMTILTKTVKYILIPRFYSRQCNARAIMISLSLSFDGLGSE